MSILPAFPIPVSPFRPPSFRGPVFPHRLNFLFKSDGAIIPFISYFVNMFLLILNYIFNFFKLLARSF